MCRWLAYTGAEVFLEQLIFEPENSLARQSLSAQHTNWPTNGDGFGVGWYGTRDEPGLFRDVLPAWNDSNLRNVSAQIQSGLFFAHSHLSQPFLRARPNETFSRYNLPDSCCASTRQYSQRFLLRTDCTRAAAYGLQTEQTQRSILRKRDNENAYM